MYRVTASCLIALALLVGAAAAKDLRWDYHRREGTVVHATATHLVMAARTWEVQAPKTYRYRLAPKAMVTCDGMLCSLQDLRPGLRVRVTTAGSGDESLATRVEALDEQSAFPVAIGRAQSGQPALR